MTLSKYVSVYEQMWKWVVKFQSKCQGRGINIDRVSSIRLGKSLIFVNISRADAIAKWLLHELPFSYVLRACTSISLLFKMYFGYTLSGSIGKVVASHAEGPMVARSNPGCGWAAPIYTMHEALRRYTVHEGGGCDQSIGSTLSDAIVGSWLWSTATRSSPLCYFSRLLQVVDNWPHILWQ